MLPKMGFLLFLLLCFLFHGNSTTLIFPEQALPTSSGYLPVNSSSTSSIFYIFYEAQQPISSLSQTPILIWLQGGPGCSSMVGNFYELGPWRLEREQGKTLVLKANRGAWNHLFGLIFFDSPIGTGFSYAETPEEIPKDQDKVANHLSVALRSFILLNPSFRSRPIYITGESYAGKYIPAIGSYILKQNSRLPAMHQLNLKGVAIGNGLTDPVTQVATHAATAFYSGLINEEQRKLLEELQIEAVRLTIEEKWGNALEARSNVLDALQNMTGLATLYDLRRKKPYEFDLVGEFMNKEEVKKALGVKEEVVWEDCSEVVENALSEDVMKSTKFLVEELVNKLKVLLYQGQFDLRDGVVSIEAWVKTMKWEGLKRFLMAERKVWKVNGEVAGYVQRWGRLSQVVVSGAGHLVPTDQAVNSQAMIEDWVLERGLFGQENEKGALYSNLK